MDGVAIKSASILPTPFSARIWKPFLIFSKLVRVGFAIACMLILIGAYATMHMPGSSYDGPSLPLVPLEQALYTDLRYDVLMLSKKIGARNLQHDAGLNASIEYIETSLKYDGYAVRRQAFSTSRAHGFNLEVEIRGSEYPEEIVIIGAHYDTRGSTPGANDNASGVSALLALARHFAGAELPRTLRFVFFGHSESTAVSSAALGSRAYVQGALRRKESIIAMINIESIGFFTDAAASQKLPPPYAFWYPNTGNFISFFGAPESLSLLQQAIGTFRENVRFPSKGISFPAKEEGIGRSDEMSFQAAGVPSILITDTARLRYPYHHTSKDTADKLDYAAMARVVLGLTHVIVAVCTP